MVGRAVEFAEFFEIVALQSAGDVGPLEDVVVAPRTRHKGRTQKGVCVILMLAVCYPFACTADECEQPRYARQTAELFVGIETRCAVCCAASGHRWWWIVDIGVHVIQFTMDN